MSKLKFLDDDDFSKKWFYEVWTRVFSNENNGLHYFAITKSNVGNTRQITGERNENVLKTPHDDNLDFRTTPWDAVALLLGADHVAAEHVSSTL